MLFRTRSGALAAFDAMCPRLGTSLRERCVVRGERLVCGDVSLGLDGRGSSASDASPVSTERWAVHERHGAILCWFGPTRTPAWRIAPVEPAYADIMWSRPAARRWRIRTHPQEILENTVDVGHFSPVHGYRDIDVTAPFETDGPHLSMGYVVTREHGLFGRLDRTPFQMWLAIRASGLGYSRVQVTQPRLALKLRTVVMPTPRDDEHVDVRVTTQVALFPETRSARTSRAAHTEPALLAKRAAAAALAELAAHEMGRDFARDIRIWEHKRYRARPGLVAGDGPIGAYRKWARGLAHPAFDQPVTPEAG